MPPMEITCAGWRTMRETMGLTAEDVADELHVNVRTAQRWETMVTPPPFAAEWMTAQWRRFIEAIERIVNPAPEHLVLTRSRQDSATRAAVLGAAIVTRELDGEDWKIDWS